MKNYATMICLLLCLTFLGILFFGYAQQTDSAILTRLNRNWIDCYAIRDRAMMKQILADDFRMISFIGMKSDRWDIISSMGSTDIKTTAAIDRTTVRIFGNTALVVAYTHFTIQTKEQTVHGRNCYSDMYVKRKGRWQAIAAQVTLLGLE